MTLVDAAFRVGYRLAHRAQLVYWFLVRPRETGAHVAVWWNGRLLLVHCSYRRCYGLPAGLARRGERPIDAACRELREEVGIALEPRMLEPAGVIEGRDHHKTDVSHFFRVELAERPTVRIDHREIVWAGFRRLTEARRERLCPIVRRYVESDQATERLSD